MHRIPKENKMCTLRHSKLQDKMTGAYSTYVREVYSKLWSEKLVERDHLEKKLGLDNIKMDLQVRGCGLNSFGSEQVPVCS
jgi:hypothetical protein